MATHVVAAAKTIFKRMTGVVVSSGQMDKTVKVRVGGRVWNERVHKHFNRPDCFLVHDPNNSLRTGDIVSISPGWRTSRNKRHVVTEIIAPAEVPVEERPPVMSLQQLWDDALNKRATKDERRGVKQELKTSLERQTQELTRCGVDKKTAREFTAKRRRAELAA